MAVINLGVKRKKDSKVMPDICYIISKASVEIRVINRQNSVKITN